MTKLLPLAFLFCAGLASAETITDSFTAAMDREPNGLHAVVNGDFSYMQPGSGTVIGLQDVTDFSMTLTSQFAYGWNGVTPAITTYSLGESAIQSLQFDSSSDILTMSVLVNPDDSSGGVFTMGLNVYNLPVGDAPEVGIYDSAYGPASDPPVSAASAPEPVSLLLCGLGLIGLWRWKRNII